MTICENLVSVGTELITKSPKTRSGIRTLEIPASLLDKLIQQRKGYLERKLRHGADFHDGDYVVCKENGDPYTPDYYSLKYRRFIKAHGLKKIRFHDLRHTNATDAGAGYKSEGSTAEVGTRRFLYYHEYLLSCAGIGG